MEAVNSSLFKLFSIRCFREVVGKCRLFLFYFPVIFSAEANEFVVKNSSGVSRKQEAVIISRESLSALMRIPKEKIPVLYLSRQIIPSQADDITGDGVWDELVFQLDIERNSEKVILVRWASPEDVPEFPKRVFSGLSVRKAGEQKFSCVKTELRPDDWKAGANPARYRNEGPVWESEKVAFRALFDERNFNTFIGKTGNILLQDTFSLHSAPSRWGMEVIPFDSGMGAGGFALEAGGRYQTIQKAGSVYFRLLGNGPVRALFDLIYEDWVLDNEMMNVRQRISIWAGDEGYKTELQVTGFEGEKNLIVGLSVPVKSVKPTLLPLNKAVSAMHWHGFPASEAAGKLGLAILFSGTSNLSGRPPVFQAETPGFPGRSCSMSFRIRSGDVITYFTHAGWQKSNDYYTNPVQYRNTIQELGNRMEYPLQFGKVP